MQIESKIKPNTKVVLTVELVPNGTRRIRVVADSIQSRDRAITAVRRALPALETFEQLLASSDSDSDSAQAEGVKTDVQT
jgi:hypothetical protein